MTLNLLKQRAPLGAMFLFILFCGNSNVLGNEIANDRWTFESQREEIAPKHWIDQNVRFREGPTLALSADGKEYANGNWTTFVNISPQISYQFKTHYVAENISEPNRSILAHIIWQDSDGKQVGRAEYPRTTREKSADGWNIIEQTYSSPEKATRAKIELVFRWDPDGTVYWGGTSFNKTDTLPQRPVKVASIHFKPSDSKSPMENLNKFASYLDKAGQQGADIVCLPEGITVVGLGKKYLDVAEPVPGPSTEFLGKIAKKHNMYIVAGIYEKEKEVVFNTSVLLDRQGELLGKYRKVCLPREEIEGGITPGISFPVFDTDFGRIGMIICWDVFFPEPARALSMQGAEIIFMPIWGGNITLAKARAIENQVYLVSSTYGMKTGVFDQEGELLVEGTEENPIAIIELDLNKQKLWPWLGDFKNRIPREKLPKESIY